MVRITGSIDLVLNCLSIKEKFMSRKTAVNNTHDFTRQIHSTKRTGTNFAYMSNHNEKLAKELKTITCIDCRQFIGGCSHYIGKYHKPCSYFEWW